MRKILLATVFSFVIASSAMAWDNTNNGPGNNQIVDQGGVGNQNVNTMTQGQKQFQYQSSVNQNTNNVGQSQNVNVVSGGGNNHYPVSSAYAPSFGVGGTCAGTAASGGLSVMPFGLAGGGTNMDDVCRAQRLGEMDVAREVECEDSNQFRHAAYRVGRPCMIDKDRWVKEHTVVVAPVTVVVPVTPVIGGYVGHCNHFDAQGYCNTHWHPIPKKAPVVAPCVCINK